MQGKVFVDAAEAGNEVVLKGANGTFGSIAVMNAGWCKLEVNVLITKVLFEGLGAFVVQALQAWAEASGKQGIVEMLVPG